MATKIPRVNVTKTVTSIQKTMLEVGSVAKENANAIAPIDSGNLRQSATVSQSGAEVKVEWNTDYASVRYYKNNKNPNTTKWAEQDASKNLNTYKKYIQENVEVMIDD